MCSPLLLITNQSGKKRLVVNLRHVNRSLWKQKFKYEDLHVVIMLFEPGEWMFSSDLKSGYHHTDVALKHCKFLVGEYAVQICGIAFWTVISILCFRSCVH